VDDEMARSALTLIDDLRIRPITAASSLHSRALVWAARLDQSKAYDAHYLALAEQMQCPLLTAHELLVRSARGLGADWVQSLD
jgi:predicted nucleic acid-binding protein